MNYFGFWSSFYQLLDPDPDPEGKFNADPCGSGYGSGSETLHPTLTTPPLPGLATNYFLFLFLFSFKKIHFPLISHISLLKLKELRIAGRLYSDLGVSNHRYLPVHTNCKVGSLISLVTQICYCTVEAPTVSISYLSASYLE